MVVELITEDCLVELRNTGFVSEQKNKWPKIYCVSASICPKERSNGQFDYACIKRVL